MKFLIPLIISVLAVGCVSSSRVHQRSGGDIDKSIAYSLNITDYNGTIDSARVRQAFIDGFSEVDIQIDTTNSSINRISCTCNLGFQSTDALLFVSSDYKALIRCDIQTPTGIQSFEASGTNTVVSRFLAPLAGAAFVVTKEPSLLYAVAGALVFDVGMGASVNGQNKHISSIGVAIEAGVDGSINSKRPIVPKKPGRK